MSWMRETSGAGAGTAGVAKGWNTLPWRWPISAPAGDGHGATMITDPALIGSDAVGRAPSLTPSGLRVGAQRGSVPEAVCPPAPQPAQTREETARSACAWSSPGRRCEIRDRRDAGRPRGAPCSCLRCSDGAPATPGRGWGRQMARTTRHLVSTSVPLAVAPERTLCELAIFSYFAWGCFAEIPCPSPPRLPELRTVGKPRAANSQDSAGA
jgi:hypothetical protein